MNASYLMGTAGGLGWMTEDRDIYTSASRLISRHGSWAETEADRMAELSAGRGHDAGTAVWRRIACAVRTLRSRQSRTLN